MKESVYKIKNIALFLLGSCLMVFGYIRQADNQRSDNRDYASGRKQAPEEKEHPVVIETDLPEISSGTQ